MISNSQQDSRWTPICHLTALRDRKSESRRLPIRIALRSAMPPFDPLSEMPPIQARAERIRMRIGLNCESLQLLLVAQPDDHCGNRSAEGKVA
jgi:hypothetical protein